LVACSPIIQCQDAEEAEVKAILKGIKLLANSDHHEIILETDCASAASVVRSREPDRSRLWATIEETKAMLKVFEDFRIVHAKRGSNKVADGLAKLARSAGSCIWFSFLPDHIQWLVT
jgi:ribonuclease HI